MLGGLGTTTAALGFALGCAVFGGCLPPADSTGGAAPGGASEGGVAPVGGAADGAGGAGVVGGAGALGGSGGGPTLPLLGEPCPADVCAEGTCEDGVCCATPCEGPCFACRSDWTGIASGTCAAIVAGTDPKGACQGSDPACDGTCNGGPVFALCSFPEGSTCSAASCSQGLLLAETQCDASGQCPVLPPAPCASGLCNAGNDGCALLASGETCAGDDACASGHCALGVCCGVACGPCAQCSRDLASCDALPVGAQGACPLPTATCNAQGQCAGAFAGSTSYEYGANPLWTCPFLPAVWGAANDAGDFSFVEMRAAPGPWCTGSMYSALRLHLPLAVFDVAAEPSASVFAVDVDEQGDTLLALKIAGPSYVVGADLFAGNAAGGDDATLVSIAPDGTLRWSLSIGDADPGPPPFSPAHLDVAADGSILVFGTLTRDLDLGTGVLAGADPDLAYVALDAAGQVLASRRFVAPGIQQAERIRRLADASVVISGTTDFAFDLGAGMLPGGTRWVAHLDASGVALSSWALPPAAFSALADLSFDDAGDVLTATGTGPTTLEKRDLFGQLVWTHDYPVRVRAELAPTGGAALAACAPNAMPNAIDLGGGGIPFSFEHYCTFASLDPLGAHRFTVARSFQDPVYYDYVALRFVRGLADGGLVYDVRTFSSPPADISDAGEVGRVLP